MGRHDLTNAQWAKLEPLLPAGKKSGRPPVHTKRQLIDGIRRRTRAGAPWRCSVAGRARAGRARAVRPMGDGVRTVPPPGARHGASPRCRIAQVRPVRGRRPVPGHRARWVRLGLAGVQRGGAFA
ncbi:transposase [Streptomyces hygroscopicus]|uniref:transposase n=1 Tax=Streptomyces hygroscopicus TaxID=1912 RepID=UPI00363B886F